MKSNAPPLLTDEMFQYLFDIGNNREPLRISDSEWLTFEPEGVTTIFTDKVKELTTESRKLRKTLKEKIEIIVDSGFNDFSCWLMKEYLKETEANRIVEMESKIAHFKRMVLPPSHKSHDFQRAIELARQVPLIEIVDHDTRLRKTGRTYSGLCPFHTERTPSFHIYPDDNRFYCFGCNLAGNPIDYVMRRQNLTFVETVKTLTKG